MSPTDTSPGFDPTVPCAPGFCHVDWTQPTPNDLAYGAGMVNAAAAVAP